MKKGYTKPEIKKVPLKPEEAVLQACKQKGPCTKPNRSPIKCDLGNLLRPGS